MKNFKNILVGLLVAGLLTIPISYAVQVGGQGSGNPDLTRSPYGSMSIANGASYTINTSEVWHAYAGFTPDMSFAITTQVGSVKTDISAYSTHAGGVATKITTTGAHGIVSPGVWITITNTTNYNNIYPVVEIIDPNNFVIDKAWSGVDDGVGTYTVTSGFPIGKQGFYEVSLTMSGTAAGAENYDFGIFANNQLRGQIGQAMSSAIEAMSYSVILSLNEGEFIWFGVKNVSGTADIDLDNVVFTIKQI